MTDNRVMEDEANHFAMCLLMPEKFLRADIAKMGGVDLADDKKIGKLAKRYRVPASLMAIRIGTLLNLPTPRDVAKDGT